MLATAFESARSPAEVLGVADWLVRQEESSVEMLARLGVCREDPLGCVDDLEDCIGQVRIALDTLPMTDRDEEGAVRMLGYLMIASLRARQLS